MKSFFRQLILFSFALLMVAVAHAGRTHTKGPALAYVKVTSLRPTQLVVGYRYIKSKADMLGKMSEKERLRYLHAHPIPVVLGPNGETYMVDHHHLANAVLKAHHTRAYIEVLHDWSADSPAEFWAKMKAQNYVYLTDSYGVEHDVSELPREVSDLKDDPYRALAGEARDKGAYTKTKTELFVEFKWANFLRTRISRETVKSDWKQALAETAVLARSADASGLPGYRAPLNCKVLLQKPLKP